MLLLRLYPPDLVAMALLQAHPASVADLTSDANAAPASGAPCCTQLTGDCQARSGTCIGDPCQAACMPSGPGQGTPRPGLHAARGHVISVMPTTMHALLQTVSAAPPTRRAVPHRLAPSGVTSSCRRASPQRRRGCAWSASSWLPRRDRWVAGALPGSSWWAGAGHCSARAVLQPGWRLPWHSARPDPWPRLACPPLQELAAKQKELLSGYNKVQSARVAARREAIIAKNQAAEDARRAALLHKEEVTQRHLERKAEVGGSGWSCCCSTWFDQVVDHLAGRLREGAACVPSAATVTDMPMVLAHTGVLLDPQVHRRSMTARAAPDTPPIAAPDRSCVPSRPRSGGRRRPYATRTVLRSGPVQSRTSLPS